MYNAAFKNEYLRTFTRYTSKSMCEVRIGVHVYKGVVVDYSLEGIGVIMKNYPEIVDGVQAYVKFIDYDVVLKSEIVWTEELGYYVRVGFRNIGNLKGNLKYYRLPDLLNGISRSKATGSLEINSGLITRKLFILNGEKIFASSTHSNDRLGEYLVRQEKITPEEFKIASLLASQKKQRLGGVLVELGYSNEVDIYRAVETQVEIIISSLFNITEGAFQFKKAQFPAEESIAMQISSTHLIYKGIKRINNIVFVYRMCPSLDAVLNVVQNPKEMFNNLTLEDPDKSIFSYVNGDRTIQTILDISHIGKFETMKIVIALLNIGVIYINDDETSNEFPHEIIPKTKVHEEPFIPESVEPKEEPAEEEIIVSADSEISEAEEFVSPYAFEAEESNYSNEGVGSDIVAPVEEEAVPEETEAYEESFIPESVESKEEPAEEEIIVSADSEISEAEEFISPYAFEADESNDSNEGVDSDIVAPVEEETVGVTAERTAVSGKTGAGKKYALILCIILIGAGIPFVYNNISMLSPSSFKPADRIIVAEKESTNAPVVITGVSYPSFHDIALARVSGNMPVPYPDFHKMALRKLLSE